MGIRIWDLVFGLTDEGQLGDGFFIWELGFGTRDMILRTWDDGLGIWDNWRGMVTGEGVFQGW